VTVLFPQPIAHRGLHDAGRGIIENSASAFSAAIGAGYAIECDLQLTRNGVPMVFHDDALARLTGLPGRVIDISAAELAGTPLLGSATYECPQTFAALLQQVAGRALLQVELKRQPTVDATQRLADAVVAAVSSYNGPIMLESFDPGALVALRKAGATAPLGIITYGYDEPAWEQGLSAGQKFALRHLLHWPMTRFDFVSCRSTALHLPAVRLCRALRMPVTAWTIRSKAEADIALTQADQVVFEGYLAPLPAPPSRRAPPRP